MLRALYNLLLHLALPILPLRLWWRGRREPGYRRDIGERFGRYVGAMNRDRPILWLHAVSVGETRAAQPLVRALRERYPDHDLLITQMTAAGRATAEELYGNEARIAFLPYDYPWAVAAFLGHFRPRLAVLMETEIWPNLLRACKASNVPVLLANARLSTRSARSYGRVASLAREAFGDLSAIGAQTAEDAARLGALGAHDIEVTGNLKFDVTVPAAAGALALTFRAWFGERPVLLVASTREGEEALILEAWSRGTMPDATLLVIVPRHPQRFDEVARMASAGGRTIARRSDGRALPATTSILIGDSMGEMAAYYGACDVAFIGGSLLPFGGQNLIEACAAGAPVLIGPHTYNFSQAAEAAIEAGAALRVADADAMLAAAARLLVDLPRRQIMAAAGQGFCAAHRGATARTMVLIERLLPR